MGYGRKKTDQGFIARLIGFIAFVAAGVSIFLMLSYFNDRGFNTAVLSGYLGFAIFAIIVGVICFAYDKYVIK